MQALEKTLIGTSNSSNTKADLFSKESIELLFKCFKIILKQFTANQLDNLIGSNSKSEGEVILPSLVAEMQQIIIDFVVLIAITLLINTSILKHNMSNSTMNNIQFTPPNWKHHDDGYVQILKESLTRYLNNILKLSSKKISIVPIF